MSFPTSPAARRSALAWFALTPVLVFSLACGSSGSDDTVAVSEPAVVAPATPTPATTAPAAEPAPAAGGEFEGCPGSVECMNGCRTRCETEHGPMMDLTAMRACASRGGDPGTCVGEASNENTRQCFLTCRGLDPADYPRSR